MEKNSKAETFGLQCRKFVYFFRLVVFFGSQVNGGILYDFILRQYKK